MREHIQPSQREDQEHLGRPSTNPLDLNEMFHDLLVRQSTDLPKIDRSIIHLLHQIGNVGCLLRRQANRPQFFHGKLGEVRRFQSPWPRKLLQPPANGTGRTSRNLLGNDGANEHPKTVTFKAQA